MERSRRGSADADAMGRGAVWDAQLTSWKWKWKGRPTEQIPLAVAVVFLMVTIISLFGSCGSYIYMYTHMAVAVRPWDVVGMAVQPRWRL